MGDRAPRSTAGRPSMLALAGVVLTVLGVALWVFYYLSIGSERHSYAAGADAPQTVQVTAGRTYHLAVHDGVAELSRVGLAPDLVRCTYARAGASSARSLPIMPESADTKAVDQIATFVAPVSADVHVACTGVSNVFVDDADDAGFDRSGLFLVLASVALAVGVPLLLAAARMRSIARAADRPAPEYPPPPPYREVGAPPRSGVGERARPGRVTRRHRRGRRRGSRRS